MSVSGNLANLIFGNFIPILLIIGVLYIISQVKKMSDYRKEL